MFLMNLEMLIKNHEICLHTTVMGFENNGKRAWVDRIMQAENRDVSTALSVIQSNTSAATCLASVSLTLSSLIGAWIADNSNIFFQSKLIYGDTKAINHNPIRINSHKPWITGSPHMLMAIKLDCSFPALNITKKLPLKPAVGTLHCNLESTAFHKPVLHTIKPAPGTPTSCPTIQKQVESWDCLNLVLGFWRFARRHFELELLLFAAGVRGYRVWLDGMAYIASPIRNRIRTVLPVAIKIVAPLLREVPLH
ncbi:hypothetical protein KIW84_034342 [Lathyrus oleraceus]|uniref:Uncharacterized protein n=1 Tax=Pisum sativum TaxID=3888 RepID=A0A9D4Y108_PEA|nr:hypothetical protein KIW84_034340 [Pisum sativum]KAI5429724.1 hypothetical protein KIW84_034342 [Pisum sativum]